MEVQTQRKLNHSAENWNRRGASGEAWTLGSQRSLLGCWKCPASIWVVLSMGVPHAHIFTQLHLRSASSSQHRELTCGHCGEGEGRMN